MEKSQKDMQDAYNGMDKGIKGMQNAVEQQKQALAQLNGVYDLMQSKMAVGKIPADDISKMGMSPGKTVSTMPPYAAASSENGMPSVIPAGMPQSMPANTSTNKISSSIPTSIIDMIPSDVKGKMPASALTQLKDVKTPQDLKNKIVELEKAINVLEAKIKETKQNQSKMKEAVAKIEYAQGDIKDTANKMEVLKASVPGAFETGKHNYISEISALSSQIEEKFKSTLSIGLKQVYLASAISAVIGLLILALYKTKSDENAA
jgi:hypothetical protein